MYFVKDMVKAVEVKEEDRMMSLHVAARGQELQVGNQVTG